MAFKWIYFLVFLSVETAVLKHVQAATQLRLVNGLLIIEDRHPLEITGRGSSARVQNQESLTNIRSPLRESGDRDLHGHGYLNRNRGNSPRSSRRLSKDSTAEPGSTQSQFILKILNQDVTTTTRQAITETPIVDTVPEINVQKTKSEPPPTAETQERTATVDNLPEKDTTTPFDPKDVLLAPRNLNHTTAVNSVTSPTMDVITIVWYFSTFIALVAFFVVMVCSDKYCTRQSTKPEEPTITAPATPAPSYREFAPPSYDSVMNKYKSRVFIIPMLNESGELKVPDEVTPAESQSVQQHQAQVEVLKPVQNASEESGKVSATATVAESAVKPATLDAGELMVVVVIDEGQESKNSVSASDSAR